MPTEGGVFYTLGDWLRRQQSQAQGYAQSLKAPDTLGIAEDIGRPGRPSLFDGFAAGLAGAPQQGQDVELPKSAGTVEPNGTPSLLQAEPPLELEKALAGRAFEQPAPATPTPLMEGVPAQPSGQVKATINGREYDYSNGRAGGAPSLYDLNAGPQNPRAFNREYSPTGGTVSVMNEMDPSMKTIGQLQDDTAIERARPASAPGAPKGLTQGEVVDIEKAGALRATDPKNQQAAATASRGAAAAREIQQLGEHLRARGATAEEVQQAQEKAARDLFVSFGFQEGDLGALGSYLRGSLIGG